MKVSVRRWTIVVLFLALLFVCPTPLPLHAAMQAARADDTSWSRLVKDVGIATGQQHNATPRDFVVAGGITFFTASDPINGRQLWRTDGSPAGTMPVTLLTPGMCDVTAGFSRPCVPGPFGLTPMNDTLFFFASDGGLGAALWQSDGTPAGTTRVKTVCANVRFLSCSTVTLLPVNGTLFFLMSTGSHTVLWRSDGTSAGTVALKEFDAGISRASITQMGGVVYFDLFGGRFDVSSVTYSVWRSDGTAEGTVPLLNAITYEDVSPRFARLTVAGGKLFFGAGVVGRGQQLWVSDGTSAGTRQVNEDSTASCVPRCGSYPVNLTEFQGKLVFVANNEQQERALWVTDGTADGTQMIRDFPAEQCGASPRPSLCRPELWNLTTVNGRLFFFTGIVENALWTSDGTTAGTRRVQSLTRSCPATQESCTAVLNNTLYVAATNEEQSGLWKSDGTAAGTTLVSLVLPTAMTVVNGVLLFSGNDGISGEELWRSDGTRIGTALVQDIAAGSSGACPPLITNVNNTLFLIASNASNIPALWKSDGTQAGTLPLQEGLTPSYSTAGCKQLLAATKQRVFFTLAPGGDSTGDQRELWISDGTVAGTSKLITGQFGISELTDVDGRLFFINGDTLWRSDGTITGTTSLSTRTTSNLANVNGTLFFARGGAMQNTGLWKSDGIAAGTMLVKPFSEQVSALTNVNGTLFFRVGAALWKSDGSEAGTVLVKAFPQRTGTTDSLGYLTNASGRLLFVADDGTSGAELWTSDGTAAGTVQVKDINPGAGGAFLLSRFLTPYDAEFTVVNSFTYFVANDGTNGAELWKTDGTATGTEQVKDIFPAVGSALPHMLTPLGDDRTLLFAATDGEHGTELWQSDGTAAGTQLVEDLNAGARGSYPTHLRVVGSTVFFAASDEQHHNTPWALSRVSAAAQHLFARPGQAIIGRLRGHSLTNTQPTYQIVTPPRGTVTIIDAATGTFTYTPPGFEGLDTFTFIARDDTHESAPATVTVRVSDQLIFAPLTMR